MTSVNDTDLMPSDSRVTNSSLSKASLQSGAFSFLEAAQVTTYVCKMYVTVFGRTYSVGGPLRLPKANPMRRAVLSKRIEPWKVPLVGSHVRFTPGAR